MGGCFGNSDYDRWLENQVNDYCSEDDVFNDYAEKVFDILIEKLTFEVADKHNDYINEITIECFDNEYSIISAAELLLENIKEREAENE